MTPGSIQNPFDPLIARLTQRLEDDGELQREVARELHTHLDDAAAEFRAAGREEGEAEREAMAHLGAEEELAEQIWQANRRRLRTRAVVRWIARLTLLPAAIVTIMLVMTSEPRAQVQMFAASASTHAAEKFDVRLPQRGLTDEQRLLLNSDLAGLHARWPNDPEIYAAYFTYWFSTADMNTKEELRSRIRKEVIDQAMAMISEGERMEPDNALYPAYEAILWFTQAGPLKDTAVFTLDYTVDGRRSEIKLYPIDVRNPEAVERALTAVRRAASKAYWSDHTIDLAKHRLDVLGPPRSMAEMTAGLGFGFGTMLPSLSAMRTLTRYVGAAAILQAEQGDRASAQRTLESIKPLIRSMAERSQMLIELLVAYDDDKFLGAAQVAVAHAAHDEREEEFWRQRNLEGLTLARVLSRNDKGKLMWFQSPAVFEAIFTSSVPYTLDPAPGRWAEQAMVLRAALLCLLLILTAIMAWQGAVALWRSRKTPAPMLLFIGWRRLATVWLVAIGGPVLFTIGYTLLPLPTHNYGMHVVPGLRVLEMTLFVVTALVLLRAMACRALKARAVELGIDMPPARGWRGRILTAGGGILLLIATVICIGYLQGVTDPERTTVIALPLSAMLLLWLLVVSQDETTGVAAPRQRGPIVRGVIVLFFAATLAAAIVFGIGERGVVFLPAIFASVGIGLAVGIIGALYLRHTRERPYAWFAASYGRSLQPILAGAIILLGLLVGMPLRWGEMWAVRKLPYPLWFHEVELSGMKELQAQIVERMESDGVTQVSNP